MKGEKSPGSLLERGLRWDTKFQRRLGHVAVVATGGLALTGFPVAAYWTGAFAAGNYVTAEFEDMAVKQLEGRRSKSAAKLGSKATKAAAR